MLALESLGYSKAFSQLGDVEVAAICKQALGQL